MRGLIYISTNSGTTWNTNGLPNQNWSSVASSADGNTLVATVYFGGIFTSTDSGNTWTSNNAPNAAWTSVATSTDGSKLVAAAISSSSSGIIYTSADSGNTWTSNSTTIEYSAWTSVASSADGNKLVAAVQGGDIWTSQTMPSPLLNIAPTNSNLQLSWTVPSTNFVLQQSFDLSSWNDVTDAPALNLTNLQDEVIQSPTNGSSFYRLESF
ncbi:MAG TPA: hypothetical protein VGM58_06005 [Verrucomicrobiae bacterium]